MGVEGAKQQGSGSASAPIAARVIPAALWVATIAGGLCSRAFLTGFWAKYLGVALWAASVYYLVMAIKPWARPRTALVVALAVSWAVELFQLTGVPRAISGVHPLLRLVFGETFSWADLVALAVGAIAAAAIGLVVLPPLWRVRELKQLTAELAKRGGVYAARMDE